MKILINMAENSKSESTSKENVGKIEEFTAYQKVEENLANIFVEEIELRRKKLRGSKKIKIPIPKQK